MLIGIRREPNMMGHQRQEVSSLRIQRLISRVFFLSRTATIWAWRRKTLSGASRSTAPPPMASSGSSSTSSRSRGVNSKTKKKKKLLWSKGKSTSNPYKNNSWEKYRIEKKKKSRKWWRFKKLIGYRRSINNSSCMKNKCKKRKKFNKCSLSSKILMSRIKR